MPSFLTSDGVRLDYAVDDFTPAWRPTETLVLLHSAMGCKDRYFAWMPALTRRFRVVRLDLRGHGKSAVPPPDKELSIARLVRDIEEWLALLGIERAHWAGASAGGYLCQRIAMDSPERVQTMALYGATPGFAGGQAQQWLARIPKEGLRNFLAATIDDRFPIGDCDPGLVEWFLDQAGANDVPFISRFIGLMDGQDWSGELGKIKCPTLCVIPGAGKIGDQSGFERMRRAIADVAMTTYANAPHNVWDFLPDRCVADLIAFVDAHSPPAREGKAA